MNRALEKYKNKDKVWHINGFNHPNNKVLTQDTFFTRHMQFWGWATWKDRWFRFKDDPFATDPFQLISKFSKKDIKKFNLDLKHNLFWSMVLANSDGRLSNTLDIFWYAFIFMNNGLCLGPRISLTRNIGHDGSGDNCPIDEKIIRARIDHSPVNSFPNEIIEDLEELKMIQNYYNTKFSFKNKCLSKLKRISSGCITFLKKI